MPPKRKTLHDAEPVATDWSASSLAELQAELERRGLPSNGTKRVLAARLNGLETQRGVTENSPKTSKVNWEAYTIAELQVELAKRHLPITGSKSELISRLEAPREPRKAKKPRRPRNSRGRDRRGGEKRLRPFVERPGEEYKKKVEKIEKERLFMLDRSKGIDKDGFVCEHFSIAGSTGNVYDTTIGRSPKCVCMDAVSFWHIKYWNKLITVKRMRGQKCKHINYALIKILRAPENLCYQLAFLSTELESIFANAPVTKAPSIDKDEDDDTIYNGKRKPIEGECPICVFDMEADEEIVWCKAACGQNFHKECFQHWKSSKNGGQVTCVYCRTEWQEDVPKPGDLAGLKNIAPKIGNYRNVAHLIPGYQQG
ncbi:hypothetical protein BGZ60DRAFT_241636 [Tricladium varicosporioides]|nr:hypothetical protein BGZ60DRAFT_241636 [Hymenoscyphus varicosporioides]